MAAAAARSGSRRLFSIAASVPRKLLTPPPKADALPNLFVRGLSKQTTVGGLREAFLKSGDAAHGSLTVRKECRKVLLSSIRPCASYSTQASENKPKQERTDLQTIEDPFDAPTYNIPEKPVTFAEGASYSVAILAGLGVAALAGYAVFKELIFEPKEYKIFGKALARVQSDSQVTAKIGYPITGYGTESRNRAARQRIQNRVWTDEDGVEHVESNNDDTTSQGSAGGGAAASSGTAAAEMDGEEMAMVAATSEAEVVGSVETEENVQRILLDIDNFTRKVSEMLESGRAMFKDLAADFEDRLCTIHKERVEKWEEEIRELRARDAANQQTRTVLHNAQLQLFHIRQ